MAKKQPEPGFESLLEKARRFCLYRERSRHETETKIRSWGVPSGIKYKLMKALEEEKFLNDTRFAEVYARSKFNSNQWGKTKIRAYLSEMRIPRGDISDALATIPEETYEKTALALARKKAGSLKPDDDVYTRKAKIMNYLLQKGYEMAVVRKAVDALGKEKED